MVISQFNSGILPQAAFGASTNFLCLPLSFPKKMMTGKITFFTNEGITKTSNSLLYLVIKYAASKPPGWPLPSSIKR